MFEKIEIFDKRYSELNQRLYEPQVAANPDEYQKGIADSFVKTADGQYIFSYQTGAEGGAYHKILTADKLVVTVQ